MAHDGSDNLGANLNNEQFGLDDPRHYGFDGKAPGVRAHIDQSLSNYLPTRLNLDGNRPLIATQDYVVPDKIDSIASSPRRAAEPPLVMRSGGKDYVWDGHHRIAAAMQKSQKSIKVKLLDTGS